MSRRHRGKMAGDGGFWGKNACLRKIGGQPTSFFRVAGTGSHRVGDGPRSHFFGMMTDGWLTMDELMQSRLFRAGIWTLLVLLIILLGTTVSFVFTPLVVIFNTLFLPFVVSGFLYFLTYPVVDRLEGARVPRWASILLLYLGAFALIFLLVMLIGPPLQREVQRLVADAPDMVDQLQDVLVSLQANPLVARIIPEEAPILDQLAQSITGILGDLFSMVFDNFGAVFAFAADVMIGLFIVPFLLFYLLKDGRNWRRSLSPHLPEEWREEVESTLTEIRKGIASYIQGIFLVAVSVGTLVLIGYSLVGLDYALVLALFAALTNIIPFLGPIIGSIPAVIVAMLHSPLMVLKVIAVVLVVQQVESLLISPQVMGKQLSIGPLTVLLLILVAGRVAGLLGMILILPTFVIAKIIAVHAIDVLRSE